MKKQTINLTWV
uniref:Uncharacterized protein n=1 Tax=Anguilla anguilla TaxID=7936 RepID=A0A0E9Y209_ANGAN